MSKISPPDVDEKLSNGEALFVLDVRPRQAYQRAHIEGSHNVPVYDDLRRGDVDALRDHLEEIPADVPVVTVCKAGVVARRATATLEEDGYDATTLAGGMRGWNGYQNGTLGYRISSVLRRLLP